MFCNFHCTSLVLEHCFIIFIVQVLSFFCYLYFIVFPLWCCCGQNCFHIPFLDFSLAVCENKFVFCMLVLYHATLIVTSNFFCVCVNYLEFSTYTVVLSVNIKYFVFSLCIWMLFSTLKLPVHCQIEVGRVDILDLFLILKGKASNILPVGLLLDVNFSLMVFFKFKNFSSYIVESSYYE